MTEEAFWSSLEPRPRKEAEIIAEAFSRRRIGIGGETDLAEHDRDLHRGGIAFMYAEDHILTREQYLGGGVGEIRGPQRTDQPSRKRGVLDILSDNNVSDYELRRVVGDIVLLCLNPQRHRHAADLGDESRDGGDGTGEGDGGPRTDVLALLHLIDAEVGEGAATPDTVLTAAQHLSPCSATEPELPTAGPYPAICRDGGARVRIYVADTGLVKGAQTAFPWLSGVRGAEDLRTTLNGEILPYGGHGTFVAGVLSAMAPEAQIYVADVFRTAGSALESELVRRLNRAFGFGFEILHLTAACVTRKNLPLIALEAWLERLRAYKGAVCVAPAGNFYTRRPSWPGAFPDVLCVGALATDLHRRADFSDYGNWVDVYAPGQNLINAFGIGTYTYQFPPQAPDQVNFTGLAQWSGTSFSAPIVTGMIAARMARRGESAREAADALLARARAQAIPGVGPVLFPSCDDERRDCHHPGGCGCGCGCGCRRGCGCGSGCGCGCGGGWRRPLRDVIEAVTRTGWGYRDR